MKSIFTLLLLLSLGCPESARAVGDRFQCGRYLFRGKLLPRTSMGQFLQLYPNTRKQMNLLVRGIKSEDGLKYQNRLVELQAYVYIPGEVFEARAKYTQNLSSKVTPEKLQKPIQLLAAGPCKIPK